MILVKPSFEILEVMGNRVAEYQSLQLIERAGRICYKSESELTQETAEAFVGRIIKRGHESVIEHSAMSIKFIVDRGVTHEMVRHRLCAFSQESTRYCNYKEGVTFVIPPWVILDEGIHTIDRSLLYEELDNSHAWLLDMQKAEDAYLDKLYRLWTPQQARSVLPNSTKTEIVVTANFREWRHIFKLRCSKAAHPQMREIMIPTFKKCKELIPVIFDNIEEEI